MRKNILSRTLTIVFAALLALGSLTSCANVIAKKPTNATELYEAFLKSEHDNSRITGDVTLSAGMGSLQFSLDTALDLQLNGGNVHGTIASRDGASTMEIYAVKENDKQILYYKGFPLSLGGLGIDLNSLIGNEWYVSESDATTNTTDLVTTLDESLFTDAQFEEGDGTYIVTVSGEALAKQVIASLENTEDTAADRAETAQTVNTLFKDASLKLTFDNQYRLISVYMAPVKAAIPSGGELLSTNIDVTLGFDLTISDFGNISPIEVPAEIVASAISADQNSANQLGGIL